MIEIGPNLTEVLHSPFFAIVIIFAVLAFANIIKGENMSNLLRKWAFKPAKWNQFWLPQSGFTGGLIMAMIFEYSNYNFILLRRMELCRILNLKIEK